MNPIKYYKVLNAKDTNKKAEIYKTYKELYLIIYLDKNKYLEAIEAFKGKY